MGNLTPWGGSSSTTDLNGKYSVDSPFGFQAGNPVYAQNTNAAIRASSLITTYIWNKFLTDLTIDSAYSNVTTVLDSSVLNTAFISVNGNNVVIGSGKILSVTGNATVGGTLGVTGTLSTNTISPKTGSSVAIANGSGQNLSTNKLQTTRVDGSSLTLQETTGSNNIALTNTDGIVLTGNTSVVGTLSTTGNFTVNTDKFTVNSSDGNTTVAGTLGVTRLLTANGGLTVNKTVLNANTDISLFEQTATYSGISNTLAVKARFQSSAFSGATISSDKNLYLECSNEKEPDQTTYKYKTIVRNLYTAESPNTSVEERLTNLGFKRGDAGADYKINSSSPVTLSDFSLRKLGKLVLATGVITIENIAAHTSITYKNLFEILNNDFKPWENTFGTVYRFYYTTKLNGQDVEIDETKLLIGFSNSYAQAQVAYTNGYTVPRNIATRFMLSWFTVNPTSFYE